MNIFAKEKKQIILRREDLVKNTRLLSKELSKLFFGNTHFFEHYRTTINNQPLWAKILACFGLVSHCTKQETN